MLSYRIALVPFLALASAALTVVACSEEASDVSTDEDDAGDPATKKDAETAPRDPGAPLATIRVAHLAPELGRVDFCYRASGTSAAFEGPVLGGAPRNVRRDGGADAADATADEDLDAAPGVADAAGPRDGGAAAIPSIGYGTVTRDLALTLSGPLDVAVVVAGESCAGALLTRVLTLDPGKRTTVVILGRSDVDAGAVAGLGLVAFVDDRTTAPDRARVRLVHAAFPAASAGAAVPLAVRVEGSRTVTLAERIEPRRVTTASEAVPVDGLGYATVAPLPPPAALVVTTAAGVDAAADSSLRTELGDLALHGGSLHTGFVMPRGDDGIGVLWCDDTRTSGEHTACAILR